MPDKVRKVKEVASENEAKDVADLFEEPSELRKNSRLVNLGTIIAAIIFGVYFNFIRDVKDEKVVVPMKTYLALRNNTLPDNVQYLAKVDEHIDGIRFHEVKCKEKGYWREEERKAAPKQCGAMFSDSLISKEEVETIRKLTAKLLDEIGYQSASYEESVNIKRIRLYEAFVWGPRHKLLTEKDFDLINRTSDTVKRSISNTFGIPYKKLLFAPVTEMTRFRPVTQFREFRHIDKVRSPPLIVTSIIWLSTVGVDFEGGRVEFLTGGPEPFTPLIIEPKKGRFGAWTSGYENPHGVMELESGERLALLFAFTTDPEIGHRTMDDLKEFFLREQ